MFDKTEANKESKAILKPKKASFAWLLNKVDKKCGKANFLKGGKDLVQKSYAKGLFIFLSRSETLESFQFCIGVNGGFIKGERDCTNIDKNASFTPPFSVVS